MGKEGSRSGKRNCIICGSSVSGSKWKYCSHECYQKALKDKYNTLNPNTFKGTSTGTTGAISELRVAVDLMSRGYNVFRAMSPACTCDLAVLQNGELLRIEVRTAHITTSGKIIYFKKTKDKTDIWALVLPQEIIYEPPLF